MPKPMTSIRPEVVLDKLLKRHFAVVANDGESGYDISFIPLIGAKDFLGKLESAFPGVDPLRKKHRQGCAIVLRGRHRNGSDAQVELQTAGFISENAAHTIRDRTGINLRCRRN